MDKEYTGRLLQHVAERVPDSSNTAENHATLLKLYDAIARYDYEAAAALLADDVELEIRGAGSMDGSWQGCGPVIEAARHNYQQVRAQQPAIEGMIVQGESIVVMLRERGVFVASGDSYHWRAVQWFTMAGGKVKCIRQIAAAI